MSKSVKACCSKQKADCKNEQSKSCCSENEEESQNNCDGQCNHKNCKCRNILINGLLKDYRLYGLITELTFQKFQILNEPLHKGYVAHWFLPKIS